MKAEEDRGSTLLRNTFPHSRGEKCFYWRVGKNGRKKGGWPAKKRAELEDTAPHSPAFSKIRSKKEKSPPNSRFDSDRTYKGEGKKLSFFFSETTHPPLRHHFILLLLLPSHAISISHFITTLEETGRPERKRGKSFPSLSHPVLMAFYGDLSLAPAPQAWEGRER